MPALLYTTLSKKYHAIKTICVEPIRYSESVMSFLSSKNITTNGFGKQTDNFKLDSISKYISDNRFISWKRGSLRNSFLGNIFKKNRAIGLSNILFDGQNTIALVKCQVYSKNKQRSKNPSKIIILKRIGNDWKIIGSVDEMQPTFALAIAGRDVHFISFCSLFGGSAG